MTELVGRYDAGNHPPPVQPARIAIVDDSEPFTELLTDILREAGYDVATFLGEVSTDALAEVAPRMVILDLTLASAELSGWDLLRAIRGDPRLHGTPVLICSADVQTLAARQAEVDRDVSVDVLRKPFGLAELERAVTALIDGHQVPTWDDEHDLVLVADGNANFIDASAAMLRVLGLTMAELRGRMVGDIVEYGREWAQREWDRYLAAREWHGPVALRTARGEVIRARAEAEILIAGGRSWHLSRLTPEEPAAL